MSDVFKSRTLKLLKVEFRVWSNEFTWDGRVTFFGRGVPKTKGSRENVYRGFSSISSAKCKNGCSIPTPKRSSPVFLLSNFCCNLSSSDVDVFIYTNHCSVWFLFTPSAPEPSSLSVTQILSVVFVSQPGNIFPSTQPPWEDATFSFLAEVSFRFCFCRNCKELSHNLSLLEIVCSGFRKRVWSLVQI